MSLPSTSYANHGELDSEKSQFLRESWMIQDGVRARCICSRFGLGAAGCIMPSTDVQASDLSGVTKDFFSHA